MSSAVLPDSDAELLRRWDRDGDDEAFAELLQRYRRLVAGVCRRQSRNEQDAEDAFQAVFYLLARDAGSIRHPERLPGWLHTVAMRIAVKIRDSHNMASTSFDDAAAPDEPSPLDRLSETHQLRALDEEIARLPERYRQPLVLHYLEGCTYAETAQQLATSVGSVRGLLRSGTRRLRRRLVRRGVSLAGAVALLAISERRASALDISVTVLRQRLAETVPPRGIDGGTTFVSLTTSTSTTGALAMPIPILLVLLGLMTVGAAVFVPIGAGPAGAQQTAQLTADARPGASTMSVAAPQQNRPTSAGSRQAGAPAQPVAQWVSGDAARYAQLERVLNEEATMDFLDEPLESVAAILSERHRIPILIDTSALDDLGLTRDEPITIQLPNVSLASALNLMLDDLDLTYTLEDEVLMVTSIDAAEDNLAVRVYWLGETGLDPTSLTKIIEQSVEPDGWIGSGGSSTISPIQAGAGKSGLVIATTYRTHRQIESLLAALSAGPSGAAPLGPAGASVNEGTDPASRTPATSSRSATTRDKSRRNSRFSGDSRDPAGNGSAADPFGSNSVDANRSSDRHRAGRQSRASDPSPVQRRDNDPFDHRPSGESPFAAEPTGEDPFGAEAAGDSPFAN